MKLLLITGKTDLNVRHFNDGSQHLRIHIIEKFWSHLGTGGLADGVVAGRLFAGLTSVTAEHALNKYYAHCGYVITEQDRQWSAGGL